MSEKEQDSQKEKESQVIKSEDIYYTSNENIQVVKALKHMDKKNSDGTIARTYGTWTGRDNFYYFRPGVKVKLSKEDLKHPTIKDLIAKGKIYKTI